MKIDVTSDDIRDGADHVPNKSAVAIALRRAFPKHRLFIYSDGFEDVSTGERYEFPDAARLFFFSLPAKRKPFDFELAEFPTVPNSAAV